LRIGRPHCWEKLELTLNKLRYHTPAPSAGQFPDPDSALINGLGRYDGGPASPLSVVSVQPFKRYRMRLVSIACDPTFVFSIDGHRITVIEADGVNTLPVVVDSIEILPGQRYSFILNANKPIGNYWIRALPDFASDFSGGRNLAILRYSGAAKVDPTTSDKTDSVLLKETDLHPLTNPGAPGKPVVGGADVNLNLQIAYTNNQYTINGAPFTPPSVPVLLQIMSGASQPNDLLPSGSVISLPPNKVIEISIPGGAKDGPVSIESNTPYD
jgi:iron transport multicopper oxidase